MASGHEALQSGPAFDLYQHEPLGYNEIRLLRLLPGCSGDELQCSLTSVSLDDDPEYEAVSYCWGPEEPPCYVRCDDGWVRITANLESGLNQIRYSDTARILWADQICINQSDVLERSAQVNLMGRIFQKGRRVVVWLGPDDEKTPQAPLALEMCEKFGSLPRDDQSQYPKNEPELVELGFPPASSSMWSALKDLITRPYFSRVWVFQELYFATDLLFLWGSTSIDLKQLENCCLALQNVDEEVLRLDLGEIMNFDTSVKIHNYSTLDLITLVHMASRRQAKDPRDLVFAVLGLVGDHFPTMPADYSQTHTDVRISAADCFVKQSYRLDFLRYAGTQTLTEPRHPRTTWPSWVPDFDLELIRGTVGEKANFCTDLLEPPRLLKPSRKKLCILGIALTEVTHVKHIRAAAEHTPPFLCEDIFELVGLYQAYRPKEPSDFYDDDSLLVSLATAAVCGCYDRAIQSPPSIEPVPVHKLYGDFSAVLANAAIDELEKGTIKTLQQLRDYCAWADGVIAYAWAIQVGPDSRTVELRYEDSTSADQSCLTVAQIKQKFRQRRHELKYPPRGYSLSIIQYNEAVQHSDWTPHDAREGWRILDDLFIGEADAQRFCIEYNAHDQQFFFFTESGSLGRAPPATQPGDIVVILFGGEMPYILRPTDVDGEYWFIGKAYLDGIMHGEYIEMLKAEGIFEEAKTFFTLV